jgi:hypothetical protein
VPLPDDVDLAIDRRRFAGVWANACRAIAHSDEVTVDFVRVDPREPSGMVVARITFSPQFLRHLMDDLERVWHEWVGRSEPPEEEPR